MFSIKLSKDDEDKAGLVIGLGLPIKYQTRLGVVRLFKKLERHLSKQDECPKDFSIWPVSVILPCRRAYIYKGPDDFPLKDIPCTCKNPKHRPIVWTKKPSSYLKDIK